MKLSDNAVNSTDCLVNAYPLKGGLSVAGSVIRPLNNKGSVLKKNKETELSAEEGRIQLTIMQH